MSSTAEQSLQGRLAAHASWAATANRSARTAPARAALDAKFLADAGGDPVRAAHFRKAHFARLALRSARSRRKARELTQAAELAEAELGTAGGGGADPPGGRSAATSTTARLAAKGTDTQEKSAAGVGGGADAVA